MLLVAYLYADHTFIQSQVFELFVVICSLGTAHYFYFSKVKLECRETHG